MSYLKSKQMKHNNLTTNIYFDKIQEQDLIIKAFSILLVQKGILTENEVEDTINSIKIMDKLIEN